MVSRSSEGNVRLILLLLWSELKKFLICEKAGVKVVNFLNF